MTGDPGRQHDDLRCLSCHAALPPMDDIELKAALATMPEGCYCDQCSARLAAAPSFAAWLDSEWQRQQREYQQARQQREETHP